MIGVKLQLERTHCTVEYFNAGSILLMLNFVDVSHILKLGTRLLIVLPLTSCKDHVAECAWEPVNCVYPGCGKLMSRAVLSEHLGKECPYRPVECSYCKNQVTCSEMEVREATSDVMRSFRRSRLVIPHQIEHSRPHLTR